MRAKEFIFEISDERLQNYLSRAGSKVDRRMARMSQARDRLNKGYEIYNDENPNRVIHKFEANTPAEAHRYYANYISNYDSDKDYDLRLRRSTGIISEFAPSQSRDDGDEDEESILKRYAVRWYNGSRSVQLEVESMLRMQGWDIGEIESEEGGAFVVRLGDMNGNSYIGWSAEDLTVQEEVMSEAFDQPYRLTWEQGEYGSYDAYTQLPDGSNLSIHFNLESAGPEGMDEEWQVEFWRNQSLAVTGQGDAYRIFATVLAAIDDFIEQEDHPERISFSASKEVEPGQNVQSRAKLYDRLVQRYAATWGYQVARQESGDKVTYVLVRKGAIKENFADGKKPGRKGLAKRSGVDCKQSVTKLRDIAKHSSGERQRMAHWCANMKSGKKK